MCPIFLSVGEEFSKILDKEGPGEFLVNVISGSVISGLGFSWKFEGFTIWDRSIAK